ncbi:MAG: hypothetical protein GX334_03365 [Firmicutes bacterium]|nr:hypothetical protein [Bacillota bacterium]
MISYNNPALFSYTGLPANPFVPPVTVVAASAAFAAAVAGGKALRGQDQIKPFLKAGKGRLVTGITCFVAYTLVELS